jgi:hypothetical protein
VDNEPDAAGIMFRPGIVKTLALSVFSNFFPVHGGLNFKKANKAKGKGSYLLPYPTFKNLFRYPASKQDLSVISTFKYACRKVFFRQVQGHFPGRHINYRFIFQ